MKGGFHGTHGTCLDPPLAVPEKKTAFACVRAHMAREQALDHMINFSAMQFAAALLRSSPSLASIPGRSWPCEGGY